MSNTDGAITVEVRDHIMSIPSSPMIFTKFSSAITGPGANVQLPRGTVDREVELVAVIGTGGRNIAREQAMEHIGAYCVGQDISERTQQLENSPPRFSMAKSHAGFAPTGPWLTTSDEIRDPQNLNSACDLDGDVVQEANTSMLIFDLPTQITYLSSICELYPGDLIFTGTPEGVGLSRNPQRFIQSGETLNSRIEPPGSLQNQFIQISKP